MPSRPVSNAIARLARSALRLLRDRAGNTAVIFAVGTPAVLVGVGLAVDYTRNVTTKASLQSIADGAALAGAQSLRLANANLQTVSQVVSGFVASRTDGGGTTISATTDLTTSNTIVSVQLTQTVPTVVAKAVGFGPMIVSAKAQARNAGNSLPLCVVGLDPSQSATISVSKATIGAQGCQILGDSSAVDGVTISNGAQLNAGRLCSSGGARTDGTASYNPAPQTDCPPLADPLASRAAPPVGACIASSLTVSASTTLTPGTYCDGLKITSGASVTLMAGTYVIKGAALKVTGGASLRGTDVAIYLADDNAKLDIDPNSTISLSAPATGPMAGLLIFESRGAPLYRNHNFQSRNATNMLGTIYIPRGILNIGVPGGGGGTGLAVGSSSAWTIIVARRLLVTDDQQLNLNTNYNASTVPPPAGLGPTTVYGMRPQLVN